jgi:archaellum component FlaG (FlaF/FlaG flagellin family)
VGLIFNVAVVAIAAGVIGALALLTWTLAVNAVRAVNDRRAEVAAARRRVADAEQRLQSSGARTYEALARMIDRTS